MYLAYFIKHAAERYQKRFITGLCDEQTADVAADGVG